MISNEQVSEIQLLREINSLFSKFTELRMEEIGKKSKDSHLLEDQNHFYKSLIDNALDIITVLNPDYTIKYVNPVVNKILGYSPDSLVGEDFMSFIHPDERETVKSYFLEILETPEKTLPLFKLRVRREDGVWRTLQGTGKNLLEHQDVSGVLITTRDITEIQHLERQLHQAQKMESLGLIAGGIAHDFRNLMAVILGASQMMQMDPTEQETKKYINMITSSVDRGKAITERILAFARTDTPRLQKLSGQDYLENIREITSHSLPKNVAVNVKAFDGDDLITADPGQLQQVLLNLCINASDAMEDGGEITLSLTQPSQEMIQHYRPGSTDEFLCIKVDDNGSGMPQETLERVFEPFFTTKEDGDGTGLGMSVAYSIMEQHNGWIDVKSEVGGGTTVLLGLPKAEIKQTAETQTFVKSQEAIEASKHHILLVEDEEHLRELLESILMSRGYQITVASNGQEGYEKFKNLSDSVDLILTDIKMPQLSGKKLQELIHEINPDTKLIAITGSIGVSESRSIMQEGFKAVVEKPFDIQEVLDTIRTVIVS
jgi:PAS domain S-box-containing protein